MTRKIVKPVDQKDTRGSYLLKAPPEPIPPFKLDDFLFDKQLKFVTDPHKYKIAVCSRRSGKTVACAADLIDTALGNPETVCLYITLSRNNARKLLWPELQRINKKYALGGQEDLTELSLKFPNGAIIYCSGAKDKSEIEKFRGLALKKVYIDECQSFRDYIKELIDEVLEAALLDYDGTLCLIGTPGPIPSGYFHECAEKDQISSDDDEETRANVWARHKWTFFDNPFILKKSNKTHQQLLNRVLNRRGVGLEDPSIQREYFGKWVLDSDSLWIHYRSELNDFKELEAGKWNYIMGIDLGFEDADAIAVLGWHDKSPTTYLIEESVVRKQGLTELVEEINKLQKKYDISKMVIDEGGLGKKLAEEMRRRHQLPVQAADKVRKQENVAFLNDALRTKRFKAKSTSYFAKDCQLVEIDRDKSTPDRIKLSDKYHSDIIDAVLYAFKESPAFTFQAEGKKKSDWGSKEWAEEQQKEMWEAAQRHFEEEAEQLRKMEGFGI